MDVLRILAIYDPVGIGNRPCPSIHQLVENLK